MKASLLMSLFILLPCVAHAGAWLREKGEVYAKLGVSRFTSDEIYAHSRNRKIAGPDFEENAVSLYGELGASPAWTGIVSVDFKSMVSESTGTAKIKGTESGPADLWLYAKRGLMKDPFVLSTQFGVKLPLGYDRKSVPPLGEGQVDLEARVLVGKSFHPFPAYGNAEIGYRKRNGDYSDVMPFVLETGVYAAKNILLKLALTGISNLTNDRASDIGVTRAPNVFDKEYMKLAPALILIGRNGTSLEIFFETFISGANTAVGDTIGIGLAWQGVIF